MFEHITIFMSFIYAIAITHLLSTTNELILARDRVKISWLLVGWMVAALQLLVINWLSVATLSTIHWTLADALRLFGNALIQYFTCSLVSMRVEKEGTIDMPAFFARQRPVILTAVLALGVAAALSNYLDRNVGSAGWIGQDLTIAGMELVLALALFVRTGWAQGLAVIIMLGDNTYFLVRFVTFG